MKDWLKAQWLKLRLAAKRFFQRPWYLLLPVGVLVGGTIGWFGLKLGGLWSDLCIGLAAGLTPQFTLRFVDVCWGLLTGIAAAILWHVAPIAGFCLVTIHGVVFSVQLWDYVTEKLKAKGIIN